MFSLKHHLKRNLHLALCLNSFRSVKASQMMVSSFLKIFYVSSNAVGVVTVHIFAALTQDTV